MQGLGRASHQFDQIKGMPKGARDTAFRGMVSYLLRVQGLPEGRAPF